MKYKAHYDASEHPVGDKALSEIKEMIHNLAGYKDKGVFKEYETAVIVEYNIIGRQTAQHYFSMIDRNWHRSSTEITSYYSWQTARQPYKKIAQWILKKLGYSILN